MEMKDTLKKLRENHHLTQDQLAERVMAGEIKDAKTVALVLKAKQYLGNL